MATRNTKGRFLDAFATLCEVFGKKPTKLMLEVYFRVLQDFAIADVEQAISRAIGQCKFFPKPAELKEFIAGVSPPPPTIEDKALAAANRIVEHLHTYGATRNPDLNHDPVAKRLMKTRWPYQGWASRVLESELKWWVKAFCAAYKGYVTTDAPAIEHKPDNGKLLKLVEGITKPVDQGNPEPNIDPKLLKLTSEKLPLNQRKRYSSKGF